MSRPVGSFAANNNVGEDRIRVNTPFNAILDFSTDAGDTTNFKIIWDGNQDNVVNTNLIPATDLTGGSTNNVIRVNHRSDQAGSSNLKLTLYDGTNSSSVSFSSPGGNNFIDTFLLLSGFSGVDLTQIRAVTLEEINGPTSIDMQIDFIGAERAPEPASLLMLGGGLLALSLFGRKLTSRP